MNEIKLKNNDLIAIMAAIIYSDAHYHTRFTTDSAVADAIRIYEKAQDYEN